MVRPRTCTEDNLAPPGSRKVGAPLFLVVAALTVRTSEAPGSSAETHTLVESVPAGSVGPGSRGVGSRQSIHRYILDAQDCAYPRKRGRLIRRIPTMEKNMAGIARSRRILDAGWSLQVTGTSMTR